jgi:hypothetical protein
MEMPDKNYLSVDLDFFKRPGYWDTGALDFLLDVIVSRGIRDVLLEPDHEIMTLLPRKCRLAGITVVNVDQHDDCGWCPRGTDLNIGNWGTHVQREGAKLIWIKPSEGSVSCGGEKGSIPPKKTIPLTRPWSAFWKLHIPAEIEKVAFYISRPFFDHVCRPYALTLAIFQSCLQWSVRINGKPMQDWSVSDLLNIIENSREE